MYGNMSFARSLGDVCTYSVVKCTCLLSTNFAEHFVVAFAGSQILFSLIVLLQNNVLLLHMNVSFHCTDKLGSNGSEYLIGLGLVFCQSF